MVTAGTAIKANLGVTIFAYLFTGFEVAWVVLWAIAFSGTMNATYSCNENVCTDPNYGILFVLLVSFYFTQQVLQSCVHVTVAGTVGTWVSLFPLTRSAGYYFYHRSHQWLLLRCSGLLQKNQDAVPRQYVILLFEP
jgi:hypothetical protein